MFRKLAASALVLGMFVGTARAAERPRPGVVFLVGGVGGIDLMGPAARWAFRCVGVPHDMVPFVWTTGAGRLLRDLQDTRNLTARADELAALICRLKSEDPTRPVYVVGHSGGTGLALAAVERLPGATVERVVLLSAAVSPGYDLRPALRATRGEVVSYHSPLDLFWLGWGTTQFGTIDRVYAPSAGLLGFAEPAGLDEEGRQLYGRLVQVGWEPSRLLANHGGLHVSTILPGFLSRHVAPWLMP